MGWIGTNHFFASDVTSHPVNLAYTFFFYQLVFAATASTIVSGAIAERSCFIPQRHRTRIYGGRHLSDFWALGMGEISFIRNRPAGWEDWGFIDFAGSTVVHSIGGWFAPAGAWFWVLESASIIQTVLQILWDYITFRWLPWGTFFLWFGWFGFNGGSLLRASGDIGLIITNTNMAVGSSRVSALRYSITQRKRLNAGKLFTAILAGLVAITAGSSRVTPDGAIYIGLITGIVSILAQTY